MKKYIFFFITFALVFSSCTKEEGCTDPLATNFNVDAENDDGSCIFGLAGGEWITESITFWKYDCYYDGYSSIR